MVATMTKDEQIAVLTRTISEYQMALEREKAVADSLASVNSRLRKRLDDMEADGNGDD